MKKYLILIPFLVLLFFSLTYGQINPFLGNVSVLEESRTFNGNKTYTQYLIQGTSTDDFYIVQETDLDYVQNISN